MNGPSELLRLIEAERQENAPSGMAERSWQRLHQALARGAVPPKGLDGLGVLSPGGGMLLAKVGGILALGVGVTAAVGYLTRAPFPPAQLPAQSPSAVSARPRPYVAAPSKAMEPSDLSQGTTPSAAEPSSETKSLASTRASGARALAGTAARPGEASSLDPNRPEDGAGQGDFERELELIRQSKALVETGRAGEAIELLGQHQREFPQGVFASERVALGILARCKSGTSEAATRAARQFLAEYPRSLHRDRVRHACRLEDEQGTTKDGGHEAR
jgi:hypothetical protein